MYSLTLLTRITSKYRNGLADVTDTDEPYDPDLLDVDAVNRALAGCAKAA
jgi:hypothetical protein